MMALLFRKLFIVCIYRIDVVCHDSDVLNFGCEVTK